jgi:hypothetical protein
MRDYALPSHDECLSMIRDSGTVEKVGGDG